MQYQSFRGADLKEALSAVKATLGPNAMIESTRQISNGRGGGLGHSYVEVTAAPPVGLKWPFASKDALSSATARTADGARRAALRPAPTGARPPKGPASFARDPAEVERELVALRQMLDELNQARPPRERALALLHAAGIEGALARELCGGAGRTGKRDRDGLRQWLIGRIKERLTVSREMLADPTPRVIAAVGPTGVGKTTTLAKLAARARLDHGRSVGVISLDTFRVGAVEQWQRYATLMGIPFQIAADQQTFTRALDDMPADLILVDTAGRSVHGTAWPLSTCLPQVADRLVNVMLVLPAWLRASDVGRVLELYDDPMPTDVVVTKLDETYQVGGVLHAALPKQLPFAFLCNGPRVPEDILDATVDGVLDAIFSSES
ncbi:MAG TPA: flagellar biosynthesis protein FlhF [Polyangiaceae bacterium]